MPRYSLKRGKQKEGLYHIQHVNALHSNLKKWMSMFNGVATKYISNYIRWFKWLQIFDTDKEIIKAKNFIIQSNVTHSYIKIKDLKNREPVYVEHVWHFVNYVIISVIKNYNLMNNGRLLRIKMAIIN